jgi:hypothetical protein
MPERRHLFGGIHDPAMVASGLMAEVRVSSDGAQFSLTSNAIGHAFPTYATPKVVMHAVALDLKGQELPGSAVERVLQRVVRYGTNGWVGSSDTRLMPGHTVSLNSAWNANDAVRFWLEVHPDDYYHREVYPDLMKDLEPDSPASTLIKAAIANPNGADFGSSSRP